MSAAHGEDPKGPLDLAEWPERLTARVVSAGSRPRLHGYDVEGDLARHYSFAETVLLALTGEPPDAATGRAFEVALTFAAPAPVSEAPTHAAVVARACLASPSQLLGVAAIALAEQARALVDGHAAWVEALSGALPPQLPADVCAADDEERASVERLRRTLRGTIDVPGLAGDVSRAAALIATLHACGLRTGDRIESALVLARLSSAMAEALATPPGSHREYPVLLPSVVYVEDRP